MSTITPECIQPISADFLKKQVETGGLVPDYAGPEIWDCTDERPLAPFLDFRRRLEFGEDTPSFAIAGAREGFSLFDLVLRASTDGERALKRYERFLERNGSVAPFICHSVTLAQSAQYGQGQHLPEVVQAFDAQYGFFRRLRDPNISAGDLSLKRERLAGLMADYDAAILNTHSDTHHERESRKIRPNETQPDIGCAHNKLVGIVSQEAADEALLPAAEKLAGLLGFDNLPFDKAVKGFKIVARNINSDGKPPYSVKRETIIAEHTMRRKPADVILDGDHLPPNETSLIVDGATTARNVSAQTKAGLQTFMSNPVKAAERLGKTSEYGEDTELAIAAILLHGLTVRNRLCGTSPQNDPSVLPVQVTPYSKQMRG